MSTPRHVDRVSFVSLQKVASTMASLQLSEDRFRNSDEGAQTHLLHILAPLKQRVRFGKDDSVSTAECGPTRRAMSGFGTRLLRSRSVGRESIVVVVVGLRAARDETAHSGSNCQYVVFS